MLIQFATKCRHTAIQHLKGYYPDASFDGTEKPVSDFLDLVDAGMFRVPDPKMHSRGAVMPGENFTEDQRDTCTSVAQAMHDFLTSPDGKPEGGAA